MLESAFLLKKTRWSIATPLKERWDNEIAQGYRSILLGSLLLPQLKPTKKMQVNVSQFSEEHNARAETGSRRTKHHHQAGLRQPQATISEFQWDRISRVTLSFTIVQTNVNYLPVKYLQNRHNQVWVDRMRTLTNERTNKVPPPKKIEEAVKNKQHWEGTKYKVNILSPRKSCSVSWSWGASPWT